VRILVVEDEPRLAAALRRGLGREGFGVDVATTGTEGLWLATEAPYDAIVLDVLLPEMNGYQVCAELRARDRWTPILMLTAKDGPLDEVEALDTGADDFLSKPFEYPVLLARLRALLRRCRRNPYEHAMGEVRAGDLVLDLETYEARTRHGAARLTVLEFKVLHLLAMNEGRVIPYARLVDHAWGFAGGDASLLKTHVSHVRTKLRLPEDGPGSIRSLPGVGYSLVKAPVAPTPPLEAPAPPRRLPLRYRSAARGAARLGVSPDTIGPLRTRCLRRLRAALSEPPGRTSTEA
jgi:DNA-binding response OmpR family regulator